MDEMNELERQLAGVVRGALRPPRPVDAAAIVRSAAADAPRSRWPVVPRLRGRTSQAPTTSGFAVFSALRFAAAAVVVALFGGFLLMGVLSTPQGDEMAPAAVTGAPSDSPLPTTTDDILPGVTLTVEEAESGIYRVIDDGVRDLGSTDIQGVAAGYDGNIWLPLEDEFLRLGSEEAHAWPTVLGPKGYDLEVGPGGTVWTIPSPFAGDGWTESTGRDVFRSTDGEEWSVMPCPDDCTGVTVAPDGVAWASWTDGEGAWRVGRLGPSGWQPLDGPIPSEFSPGGFGQLVFTDSGDIYGVAFAYGDILYRYEDGTWRRIDGDFVMPIRVGRDGTAWGIGGDRWHRGLTRLADDEWSHWTHEELPEMAWSSDGSTGLGIGFEMDDGFRVAADGSLWARLWRGDDVTEAADPDASMTDWSKRFNAVVEGRAACDGVVRFDGLTANHFLPGRCLTWDFANDGSVWVLAGGDEDGSRDLYVITPEASGAAVTDPSPPETTESPAPETTAGLLSDMVTEEVQPGVFRVVNDGYRDVSHPDDDYSNSEAVMVGDVGDVWRITAPRTLFRLGQEGEWSYDPGLVLIGRDNTEATPDGQLWTVAAPDDFRIFDGGAWNYPDVQFGEHYETLAAQSDGTVWLLAEDSLIRVPQRVDDVSRSPSWKDAYDGDDDWVPPRLAVTDAGEAWLVDRGGSDNYYDFLRFDGETWQVVSPPVDTAAGPQAYWSWDVGPDGTLWTVTAPLSWWWSRSQGGSNHANAENILGGDRDRGAAAWHDRGRGDGTGLGVRGPSRLRLRGRRRDRRVVRWVRLRRHTRDERPARERQARHPTRSWLLHRDHLLDGR